MSARFFQFVAYAFFLTNFIACNPSNSYIVPKSQRVTVVAETSSPQAPNLASAVPSSTAAPTNTRTLTATGTATPTHTWTWTPAPTATTLPTLTPTNTPTVDSLAVPVTLGGTRYVARDSVVRLAPPPPLQISPAFLGTNYWTRPFSRQTKTLLKDLNLVVLRGGFDNMRPEKFDWALLDRFIADARQMNVEPLIQVPYHNADPKFAARIVRYVNVKKKHDVRFWSIGNEEDTNYRGGARDKWLTTWRSYRDAMKAVDARILIFGPEYANAYDITDPARDWLTPFLQMNGDAVDVISLHRYGFGGKQSNPTVLIGDALGTARRIRALREHIQRITGRDIPLAITEMNLSHDWKETGEGSSASFSAGLWMAESLGQMAEAGVAMVNIWSAQNDGTISLLDNKNDGKRPTYYALELYANYGNRVIPAASHVRDVSVHGGRDTRTGRMNVVLVNRGRREVEFKLVLNSGEEQTQGNIYLDAGARKRLHLTMPAHSMMSLSLNNQFQVTRTMLYSRAMYDNKQPPVYATTP